MNIPKITVGLQQKIGQPNFGSIGASCVVEVQLDPFESEDGEAIEQRVRQAFARCRRSIDDELRMLSPATAKGPGCEAGNKSPSPVSRPRGHRPATDKQIRAIQTIAGKQGIMLASELQARFHVTSPDQLSISQASALIDAMKETEAAV
ncbi:hypothetical protein Poly51_61350 [Rubripirellula tenax]|uniref:Uncharacterized protein n=1 Tax=Rubripirellula tenax TaxID=2528015 RepID=A0A5C6EB95_9BACT|nr:hypothetical protein [Rubripirellula tenax]TWU44449.1 hypothetical protein Poly51_61350 [Rubripirellula tenax]